MKDDKALKDHLRTLLTGEEAHSGFEATVKDFPSDLRGVRPSHSPHSPWELLEHLRITLWDILEFSRDPKHESPEFPAGYWPNGAVPPDENAWDESVATFQRELGTFVTLVCSEDADLFSNIPHGSGQTMLREALLAADHTSYHVGQLMLVRRMLEGS